MKKQKKQGIFGILASSLMACAVVGGVAYTMVPNQVKTLAATSTLTSNTKNPYVGEKINVTANVAWKNNTNNLNTTIDSYVWTINNGNTTNTVTTKTKTLETVCQNEKFSVTLSRIILADPKTQFTWKTTTERITANLFPVYTPVLKTFSGNTMFQYRTYYQLLPINTTVLWNDPLVKKVAVRYYQVGVGQIPFYKYTLITEAKGSISYYGLVNVILKNGLEKTYKSNILTITDEPNKLPLRVIVNGQNVKYTPKNNDWNSYDFIVNDVRKNAIVSFKTAVDDGWVPNIDSTKITYNGEIINMVWTESNVSLKINITFYFNSAK